MNTDIKQHYLAIIDDDEYWIDLIQKIWKKEFPNNCIEVFKDFKNFIESTNALNYKIIITDYHFGDYNLDTINIEDFFQKYKGKTILITGYPNSVLKTSFYDKIINKAHLVKPIFKFSRYINN